MSTPKKNDVWEIEPHTQAKHEILQRYLDAYFPIMCSWNQSVSFVDGFAGPGEYANGEAGSPQVAIRSALKSQKSLLKSDSHVQLLFNEQSADRFRNLESVIGRFTDLPDSVKLYCSNNQFSELAKGIVQRRVGKKAPPTFAFVDPFGYSDVPISLLAELLKSPKSELFILFSYNAVNRFVNWDKQKHNMDELFGTDEYLQCEGLSPDGRKKFLADLYEKQLKKICNFNYVSRFEMLEKKGRTTYFLYHCTRSLRGLEVMRESMWKVDPLSGCQFSDKVAGLESLFSADALANLDQELKKGLSGSLLTIRQVEEFVLTQTVYPKSMLRKTLKSMQKRGEIQVEGQKRRGTFPTGTKILFIS